MEKKIVYVSQNTVRPWTLRYEHGTPEDPGEFGFSRILNLINHDLTRGEIYDYEVRIEAGTYYIGPVDIPPALSAHVTFTKYGEGDLILSGGRRITGFTETTVGGVRALVADLPLVRMGEWYFEELNVNKRPCMRPVYPAGGKKLRITDIPGHPLTGENGNSACRFAVEKGIFDSITNVEDTTVEVIHFWVSERFPVVSYDKESGVVTSDRFSRQPLKDSKSDDFASYRILNVFEQLKEPGQFYLNRKTGKLYYIPREGETADNILVEAPVHTQLFRLHGKKDEPIAGLSFRDIVFECTKSDPCDSGEEKKFATCGQAASKRNAAVSLEFATLCSFENCTFRNIGNYALELGQGSTRCRVCGCEISGTGAGGIKVTGGDYYAERAYQTGYNLIENCHIHHCTLIDYGAIGIFVSHAHSNRIAHNHIHDLKYSGISVGWVWGMTKSVSADNIIEYNHIHHCGDGDMSDMGGIYLLGPQGGTEVRGNYIHHIRRDNYGGWGIYLDEGSVNVLVEGNIVHDTDSNSFFIHYGQENIVRYNIFNYGGDGVIGFGAASECVFATFYKNILFAKDHALFTANYNYDYKKRWLASDANFIYHTAGAPIRCQSYLYGDTPFDEWRSFGQDLLSQTYAVTEDTLFLAPTPDAVAYGFPSDVTPSKAGIQ